MAVDHNPPAFPPNAGWRDNDPEARGMSLRDYFAGQTLSGLAVELVRLAAEDGVSPRNAAREMAASSAGLASIAYTLADAMLIERAKP
jgi:hypothetical protein